MKRWVCVWLTFEMDENHFWDGDKRRWRDENHFWDGGDRAIEIWKGKEDWDKYSQGSSGGF